MLIGSFNSVFDFFQLFFKISPWINQCNFRGDFLGFIRRKFLPEFFRVLQCNQGSLVTLWKSKKGKLTKAHLGCKYGLLQGKGERGQGMPVGNVG